MITVLWQIPGLNRRDQTRKADAENWPARRGYSTSAADAAHFLFNSLNSINALIGSRPANPEKWGAAVVGFSAGHHQKIRTSLSVSGRLDNLPILEIEKVRFGCRLNTKWTSTGNPEMEATFLLMQPLMENAIKFGLYGFPGEVTISLRLYLRTNTSQ